MCNLRVIVSKKRGYFTAWILLSSLSIAVWIWAPFWWAYFSTIAKVLWPLMRLTVGRSTPAWTKCVIAVCRNVCRTTSFGFKPAFLTTLRKAFSIATTWKVYQKVSLIFLTLTVHLQLTGNTQKLNFILAIDGFIDKMIQEFQNEWAQWAGA